MRKIIALLIVLLWMVNNGFAQTTNNLNKDHADTDIVKIDTNEAKSDTTIEKQKVFIKDNTTIDTAVAGKDCKSCMPIDNAHENVDGTGEWFLILSPFLLLLLVVSIVIYNLKDFKFTDALTENEPPKKTIKNPEYNAAIIVTNSSIPNLSVLFPPTIEVSNIQPSLFELREILTAKQKAASVVQDSLAKATNGSPILNKAVADAQTELNKAKTDVAQLQQAVTDAQTQLTAAPNDTTKEAAQKDLNIAIKAVADNTAQIDVATQKLMTANKDVEENPKTIAKLTAQLQTVTAEAADAKTNVDIAEVVVKNNTAYAINTYRPSISRYIAFITSLVTIILVVCMSSLFIYHYIRTGCPPDFSALTMLLITLGLGVTPYITNKITTAASTNKS